MSDSKRQKRRAQRLAKHKKKRARSSRAGAALSPVQLQRDPRAGLTWPVGPCYLSEGWHEQGAQVHAVVSRVSSQGKAVVAVFELDLAERGVVSAVLRGGLREEHLPGECARLSEAHGVSMIELPPEQVVRLVTDAQGLGGSLAEAEGILVGVDGSLAPHGALLGPLEEEPEPTPKPSLWSRLFG